MIQGLAQNVHFFYALSHLGEPQILSQLFQPIFNQFHIEIANDTVQSLNCAVGQILSKCLAVFIKSTYIFVATYFWCFSTNTDFQFYISKELTDFWEIILGD